MDDRIWARLPEDLVDMILAKLPLASLFKARAVCKRWEATTRSPAFLNKLPTNRLPWYLGFQGFRHDRGWAYDPTSGKWYILDFSFVPPGRCVAAAGGLLCFCQDNVDANILWFVNPMSKSKQALPAFPGYVKQVVMAVDTISNSYLVLAFVQDHTRSHLSPLVYNSSNSSNGWYETSHLPSHSHLSIVDAAFCKGILYCLVRFITKEWQFIRSYNFQTDIWCDVTVPVPNAFRSVDVLQMAYLLEHQNKLLFVEKIVNSLRRVSVGVYELDLAALDWRKIGALRNTSLCLGSFTSRAFETRSSHGVIYFTNHGLKVESYDCRTGLWNRFSRQGSDQHSRFKLGVIPVKGMWFEPRIDSIF